VGDGSAATPVQLKNDEENPTPGKIYSADAITGEKGWHFPEVVDKDHVIEFGFKDFLAGTAQSWDMDINCEFPYTIKHIWLRTDSGTLTGVKVKINNTAITGLDNISVTATKGKSIGTALNYVAADDTVTLNITIGYTGAPAYIGGHIYIERT
jgi:hypothetical protein